MESEPVRHLAKVHVRAGGWRRTLAVHAGKDQTYGTVEWGASSKVVK